MAARRCLLAACLGLMVSCGFRLQGPADLPAQMSRTWIQWPAEASPELTRRLDRSLRAAGAELVDNPAEATAVLDIIENQYGQRVLSVSATNIPEEFEVYHSVTFELRSGETVLFPRATITLTRDYTFDETAVLAKYQEGETIARALTDQMVQQIRRRLAVLE